MGLELTPEQASALHADLDTNGDGLLSLSEFTSGVSRALDESSECVDLVPLLHHSTTTTTPSPLTHLPAFLARVT